MKILKAAIIGCGNIYQVHAEAVEKLEQIELEFMVDIKEERAKKAAEKYNCSYLTDYNELLKKDIDVVHICTPHYLHSSMAVNFLNAEINVILEKPLSLNYEEAESIVEAENRSNAKLTVCFQNRFNKNNQKAKEIILGKTLGEIKGIKGILTWHRDAEYYLEDEWRGFYETEGGGVLINQAIHTLDLMQWFGGPIKAVKGNIDTRVLEDVIEVEDTAEATLYYDSGAVGIFYATNAFSTNSPVEIVIDCEKGSLRLFDEQLIISKSGKIRIINEDSRFEKEKQKEYKSYWGKSHYFIIKNFYQLINTDDCNNVVTAEEGVKTIKLIKAINQSAKTKEKYYLNN